jgi:DUF1680 family protein
MANETQFHPGPVIVDTSRSPHARWQSVPINHVLLDDTIWEPRRTTTVRSTLAEQYRLLELTDRIANFRRTAGKEPGGFTGIYFNDSDVYKWLEAAAWAMATDPAQELDQLIDSVIQELADAQQPDGYLDTFYTLGEPDKRWTELVRTHELYCAGHLFQAAVAHYRVTGKRNLLDVATKFADLICDTFGPEDAGKRPGTDGHEEIELAMVELGRATGNRRYIEQAAYFLDARGHGLAGGDEYHQDHVPFRDATDVVGHAVRQVYLTAGAADIYAETGDASIKSALDRLWDGMIQRRIYVSSGIGSRWEGEAFGKDFELPNSRAYTESCAAIGSVMWNWRMLLLTGEAKYADLIETTLFNAMLPGLSLEGDTYYYQNPLSDDGTHRRRPWFDCACCPPNLARTLASIGGYFATVRENEVALHLYANGLITTTLPSGTPVRISIGTAYPWDGTVRLTVESTGAFTLALRIPGWTENPTLTVNGEATDAEPRSGDYVQLDHSWQNGDLVELVLPMPVRRLAAHPHLFENRGRVAIMRGPVLYCLEQAGNRGVDPKDVRLPADAELTARHAPDLLGGVTVIEGEALVQPVAGSWVGQLYQPVETVGPAEAAHRTPVTLIPYFVWANREPGPMEVWLGSA